jgi:transcriptional regulator with XRE-family HTH domain
VDDDGLGGKPCGARWFSCWLRARREALGLDRRRTASAGRRGARPLTVTLLADLEIGDRFPSLAVLPALASALRVPPWTLAERVRVAPLLETTFVTRLERSPQTRWLEHAQAANVAEDHAATAAAADLAAQTAPRAEQRQSALLALADALTPLGFPALATFAASHAYQRAEDPTQRLHALLALAEASLADGSQALAAIWLALVEDLDRSALPAQSLARAAVIGAELELARGRAQAAVEGFAHAVAGELDSSPPVRRRACRGLAEALRRCGRARDAQHWDQLAAIGPAAPPRLDLTAPVPG